MQVTAFSTPPDLEWLCNYGGETVEESRDGFLTIAAAVARGAARLEHMNAVDRSQASRGYPRTVRHRGR